jgi:hypothetical protein
VTDRTLWTVWKEDRDALTRIIGSGTDATRHLGIIGSRGATPKAMGVAWHLTR